MIEVTLTAKLKRVVPKVYPNKAPQTADGPLVVYMRTGTDREALLSGPGGIAYATFRIDVYDTGYLSTITLADALRAECNGWKEAEVMYCSVTNDIDFGAEPDEDGFYRRSIELSITYLEQ